MLSSDQAEPGIVGLEDVPSRRRRIWVMVARWTAAVMVAGFGAVVLVWEGDGDLAEGAREDLFGALPEVIGAAEDAARLPEDGSVGRGAMVYQACRDCGTVLLVLADGKQLVLSESVGRSVVSFSLSPDGRWLTAPDAAGVVVRDLSGTEAIVVVAEDGEALVPWVWSPDSSYLLFAVFEEAAEGASLTGYRLLDVLDGSDGEIAGSPDQDVVAVLPSGQLLGVEAVRGEQTEPVATLDIDMVDPTSDGAAGGFTVDASEWLQAGETLADNTFNGGGGAQLILAPDGDGVYLTVFDGLNPVGVLYASRTGEIRERLDLLDAGVGGGVRRVAGRLGGELVLAESRAGDEMLSFAWMLYAVSGDGLEELATLAPATTVRLAGTAVHGGSAY